MRVSVVIPHYNANGFLATAVESAFDQTLRPDEVIVVDDGSERSPEDELRGYGERVRLVKAPNQGVCAARNKGIAASSGDVIAFLDADDRFAPTHLERRSKLLVEGQSGGVVGNARFMSEDMDRVLGEGRRLGGRPVTFRSIYRQNLGGACGSVFLRETLDRCGWFDPLMRTAEDWDLLLRVASRERVIYDDEPLVDVRVGRGSLTSGAERVFADSLKVLSKCAAYADSPFEAWLDGRFARFVLTIDAWRKLGDGPSRSRFLGTHPMVAPYLFLWALRAAKNRIIPHRSPAQCASS